MIKVNDSACKVVAANCTLMTVKAKNVALRMCKLPAVLVKVCVVVNLIDWICNNSHISDTQSQLFATKLAKGFLSVAPGCRGKRVT